MLLQSINQSDTRRLAFAAVATALHYERSCTIENVRVYFKRWVQPKCGVQNEKYGVQDWKMWSPK